MIDPEIRSRLRDEIGNYSDRDSYISDCARSSIWGDPEDFEIPQSRVALLGAFYDAAHCTLRELLAQHYLSQADFARSFGVPLRTVQNWCLGARPCPAYILAMAAELLAE